MISRFFVGVLLALSIAVPASAGGIEFFNGTFDEWKQEMESQGHIVDPRPQLPEVVELTFNQIMAKGIGLEPGPGGSSCVPSPREDVDYCLPQNYAGTAFVVAQDLKFVCRLRKPSNNYRYYSCRNTDSVRTQFTVTWSELVNRYDTLGRRTNGFGFFNPETRDTVYVSTRMLRRNEYQLPGGTRFTCQRIGNVGQSYFCSRQRR